MARLVGCLLALGVASGCGGAPPIATASDAARASLALADLEEGRRLLIGKCGGCHAPPLPVSQKIGDWPREVASMAERAKLTAPQHQLIVQYLVTMADAPR